MFDSVCVVPSGYHSPGRPVDLGALAEAMLFYGRVVVATDRGALAQLIADIDSYTLAALIDEGFLELTYTARSLGVVTDNAGTPNAVYQLTDWTMAGLDLDDVLSGAFGTKHGSESRGRRTARAFMPRVHDAPPLAPAVEEARRALTDDGLLAKSIELLLQIIAPGYDRPAGLEFGVETIDERHFRVHTNIDFALANESFHERVGPDVASLSPDFVLSEFLGARGHLLQAASAEAELSTNPAAAALLQVEVTDSLSRRLHSAGELREFQELTLDHVRAVAIAVNRGERSMSDVLDLLRTARRFREWLRDPAPDAKLIAEYLRAVERETWLDQVPGNKALRFAFVLAVGQQLSGGAVGAVAAAGLAAFESLLLDRLVRGWRPNQFVNGQLAPFVRRDPNASK